MEKQESYAIAKITARCTYFVFYALYYVITNCDYVSKDF